MNAEIVPFPLNKREQNSADVKLGVIRRLTEIGKVLHIPDVEILLASANFSELVAFSRRYKSSFFKIIRT